MTKREYCEHLNKLQSEAVELQTVANVEYGEFDEKLEDAICAIRAAIERLIPEEELHKSEPQRPEYDTPSFKENPEDEQIKSDKQRPQRWPEYETPSFKKSVDASVCPMCGGTLVKDEKHPAGALVCHKCRVFFSPRG